MQKIIYVDIDDTLVRSVGKTRIPMPLVIQAIRDLKSKGAILFLWSSGGSDYCKKTAEELKIADCFDGFLPKPTIYIDDQPINEWKLCEHFYPSQINQVNEIQK